MKQISNNQLLIGIAIVFLITIAVSYYGLQTLKERDVADKTASECSAVLTKIDEVLLGVVNMETGFRGYLLTGNSQLLDHYHNGKNQYQTAVKQLSELSRDDPTLEARWIMVVNLELQWDREWAVKGIQIRQEVDAGKISSDALTNHVIAERDESLMDKIRAQLAAGKQEVSRLLAVELQKGREANYRAYNVMVAAMIIYLLLGLIAGAYLNRSNIEKAKQIELQHFLLEEREKERLLLARDLHDGPVQELLGLSFTIQELLMDEKAPGIIERLQAMKTSLQTIVSELRASAMELRSPNLAKFGLQKAILADLDNLQQDHPEIKVQFNADEKADPLSEHQQAALFRIFQEALRNIIRHSKASEVNIQYQINDKAVVLVIQDNGSGFTLPDDWRVLAREGHFGLVGIRERVEAINGRLEIHSKPKEGTTIRVIVPLD